MRTTFENLKNSRIPAVLNISPEDPRLMLICNEAQQRLVQTNEHFWGLFARYRFCVTNSCLVWPREIAAIEAVSICNRALPVRNQWFEFMESGPGLQGEGSDGQHRMDGCIPNSYDRGTACTFSDIIGTGKKIKVYADIAEDPNAVILLQGYDQNGNWITTQVNGEWIDGEYVGISTTPQTSYNIFSSLVAVQKPITNGPVRLYEYNTSDATQRAIAYYETDETNPSYRKSYVGGLRRNSCGSVSDGECELKTVTVMAKLEFIPVRRDTDWLLIGNLPALKDCMQAILKWEMDLPQEAQYYFNKSVATLRQELSHYRGQSVVQPVRMQPRNVGGPAVPNMI